MLVHQEIIVFPAASSILPLMYKLYNKFALVSFLPFSGFQLKTFCWILHGELLQQEKYKKITKKSNYDVRQYHIYIADPLINFHYSLYL